MKPILEAVQALQTSMQTAQTGYMDRASTLGRAIEIMKTAEKEALEEALRAAARRYQEECDILNAASDARLQSLYKLGEATLRFQSELQDGNDDGAAAIAAAFAPPRLRNGNGSPALVVSSETAA